MIATASSRPRTGLGCRRASTTETGLKPGPVVCVRLAAMSTGYAATTRDSCKRWDMTEEHDGRPSSFAKGLALGHIDEEMVFPYPLPGDEEAGTVRELIGRFRDYAADTIASGRIDDER